MRIPLAGSANKQGRVAGANAAGAHMLFKGVQGTAIIKVDGAVKLKVDKNSLVRDYTQDTPQQ